MLDKEQVSDPCNIFTETSVPFTDIFGDVFTDGGRVLADDQACISMNIDTQSES